MYIWIILIGVMVASFIIQRVLQSKFDKYSDVPSPGGLTGAEVARLMLERNGVHDVQITCIEGKLTDHFDPRNSTINLSREVYAGRSVAACAVAAHETGHALQHATGYAPLKMRSALVPVVTFANNTVQWVLLAGVLLVNLTPALLWLGIALFAMTTFFSLVTLPVEINASVRAVNWLSSEGVLDSTTKPMAADALKWAAYTYVIAAVGSLATLIYYIAMANGRR
ncbi:MAG: zinc metallopeptidase [Bacteroidales bacterium]|nr:zinc metallopeptidase [Bacteroidales bacterium]